MYKICVVTATRAEYGLLRPLLFRLKQEPKVQLQLVVTGAHLSERFGNTKEEIIADGFGDFYEVPLPLDEDGKMGMAIATGAATQEFAKLFAKLCPHIVILLGDRYEMLGVASAAHLMGIPVAHMCGGDVTQGAVDDAVRHCLTKLSTLHFPGCEASAKRIIQMGENPERVFNVGEPGIENCINTKLLSRKELAEALDFEQVLGEYCVVTFHPVTMEDNTAGKQVKELISAMDAYPKMAYIITKANADAGGRMINAIWDEEARGRSNWLVVSSLGMLRYLSAVKYAKLVIGNSSSGLLEVPALGTVTINIGDRQKGRMMAKSVLCCEPDKADILQAMERGMSAEFTKSIKNMDLPFGNGTTSGRVLEEVLRFLQKYDGPVIKSFYDIPM